MDDSNLKVTQKAASNPKISRVILIFFSLILLVLIAEGVYYFFFLKPIPGIGERKNIGVVPTPAIREVSREERLITGLVEAILKNLENGMLEENLVYFDEEDGWTKEGYLETLALIQNNYRKDGVFDCNLKDYGATDKQGLVSIGFNNEGRSEIVFYFFRGKDDWKIRSIHFQGEFLIDEG